MLYIPCCLFTSWELIRDITGVDTTEKDEMKTEEKTRVDRLFQRGKFSYDSEVLEP